MDYGIAAPGGHGSGPWSGGLYLPFEVRLLLQRLTMLHLLVFLGNLLIVGYLAWQIVLQRRRERAMLREAGTHDVDN